MGIGAVTGISAVSTLKTAAVIGFAALMLAGCSKPKDTPAASGAEASNLPFAYAVENADVAANLSLPQTLGAYPALHQQLFTEGRANLDRFATRAGPDHAELTKQGFPAPPYAMSIGWTMAAESPRLASVYALINTDEGGAHPNTEFQSVLWDRKTAKTLAPQDLFAADADLKKIDNLLCRAVEAERSKRVGSPVRQGGNCPRLIDSRVALLPSTTGGKLGGIAVLFAPYEVGPYAEGAYEVRLPQGSIREALKPELSGEFAGDPAPQPLLADPTAPEAP